MTRHTRLQNGAFSSLVACGLLLVAGAVAHVHTGYSFDSRMFGVTLTPENLFKGESRLAVSAIGYVR